VMRSPLGKQTEGQVTNQPNADAGRDCSHDGRLSRINFHAASFGGGSRTGLIWIQTLRHPSKRTFPQQHQPFRKVSYNGLSSISEAGRDACASKHLSPARRMSMSWPDGLVAVGLCGTSHGATAPP
jgi:hypothetical protein